METFGGFLQQEHLKFSRDFFSKDRINMQYCKINIVAIKKKMADFENFVMYEHNYFDVSKHQKKSSQYRNSVQNNLMGMSLTQTTFFQVS